MLVLLVHLRLLGIGWITIQTFFVMSGFLITRILLSLRDKHPLGSYLKIFYARRTLRIVLGDLEWRTDASETKKPAPARPALPQRPR